MERNDCMDFLEKMGGTLAARGRDVADKAKEMAEVNRLRGQVNLQKNLAEKIYAEIGKLIYENRETPGSVDVSGQLEQLDSIQAETARLQEEILRVRGVRTCSVCGTEINKNAASCPKCGAAAVPEEETEEGKEEDRVPEAQEVQQVQEKVTTAFCPGCHKKIEPEMVFCPFCGVRI